MIPGPGLSVNFRTGMRFVPTDRLCANVIDGPTWHVRAPCAIAGAVAAAAAFRIARKHR